VRGGNDVKSASFSRKQPCDPERVLKPLILILPHWSFRWIDQYIIIISIARRSGRSTL
jgi:hypothetical protein